MTPHRIGWSFWLRLDIDRDFAWPSWMRRRLQKRLSPLDLLAKRLTYRLPF